MPGLLHGHRAREPVRRPRGHEVGPVFCRGFYDVHKKDVYALQLAEVMGVVEFDDPPEKEK